MTKSTKKKFVLSATGFGTIKEAEEQVGEWWKGDKLNPKTKLYEVRGVYGLRLRFEKEK